MNLNLRKLCELAGIGGDGADPSGKPPGIPVPPVPDLLVTVECLGQTLVATVIEPDLTGPRVAELSHQIRVAVAKRGPGKNLVVDLQNVEHLDSTCLGLLVELLSAVQSRGGRIAVVSAAHRVEALFKLTRLDKVFPIQRDVLMAVRLVESQAA